MSKAKRGRKAVKLPPVNEPAESRLFRFIMESSAPVDQFYLMRGNASDCLYFCVRCRRWHRGKRD
jgi:hypothetical protein